MSTRGLCGVRINGQDKLSYNHSDSYPTGLGVDILAQLDTMISDWGLEKMRERAIVLKQVNDETKPTAQQIKEFEATADFGVATQSVDDWYCLLRDLQGNLIDTLIVGYSSEGNNFINDSLFCEWGYIVNLDSNVLEVYQGFQEKPHTKGRYAVPDVEENNIGSKYYPCALIATFPLDNLPDDKDFLHTINREPFECDEDMVLHRLNDYGEITKKEAADEFGIDNIEEVIENIRLAGHNVEVDGERYELA